MCVILFLVSLRIGILMLAKHIFIYFSMLLCCYYAFILPILEYCSKVWWSAAECHLQLLLYLVYWVARPFHDQSFMLLCYWHHVDGLCILYKVNSNSTHCSVKLCFYQSSINLSCGHSCSLEVQNIAGTQHALMSSISIHHIFCVMLHCLPTLLIIKVILWLIPLTKNALSHPAIVL